jgi:hypothetical protein
VNEHLHIYSFCGQIGCKDKPWHPNTEDLVSPPLLPHEVGGYFADRADAVSPDTSVVRPCEGLCPNQDGLWLYIRLNDPLLGFIRPNHYSVGFHTGSDASTWAKA